LAAGDDRGGAGDHRARLVFIRHRAEPPLTGGAAAIHARAGTVAQAAAHRGPVRTEHAARHSAHGRAAGLTWMQRWGRLSFETGASHPPQDEAEFTLNLFLTLRRPRSGRLEGRGQGVATAINPASRRTPSPLRSISESPP